MVLVGAVRWGVKKGKKKKMKVVRQWAEENRRTVSFFFLDFCFVSNKTREVGSVSVCIQSVFYLFFSPPAGREGKKKKRFLFKIFIHVAVQQKATSPPILAGKKPPPGTKRSEIDRPDCDFGRVRRFNPSALCWSVNNCQNLECSGVESVRCVFS